MDAARNLTIATVAGGVAGAGVLQLDGVPSIEAPTKRTAIGGLAGAGAGLLLGATVARVGGGLGAFVAAAGGAAAGAVTGAMLVGAVEPALDPGVGPKPPRTPTPESSEAPSPSPNTAPAEAPNSSPSTELTEPTETLGPLPSTEPTEAPSAAPTTSPPASTPTTAPPIATPTTAPPIASPATAPPVTGPPATPAPTAQPPATPPPPPLPPAPNPPTSVPPPTEPARPAVQTLRVGSTGPAVAALKAELRSQKYAIDDGDTYTQSTRDAVMAFQKINGLDRDGIAGPATHEALNGSNPKGPQLGSGAANRVDVDLGTQTLVVVRDGQVAYIVNATSGNPNHPDGKGIATPSGAFNVERKISGTRHAPLGDLYYPSYFRGGVAVHGSNTVVAERDSHGCVRIPRHLEQRVYADMPVGSQVVVHA